MAPLTPKQQARKIFLAARRQLSNAQRAVHSQTICTTLATIPELSQSAVLAGFSPLRDEVNIREFARKSICEGRTYCLPRVVGKGQVLAMHKIQSFDTPLTTGYSAISEPSLKLPRVSLEKIKVTLVPSISIDWSGNRLGFGSGFYDITIRAMPQSLLIAPLFACQLAANLPVEEPDCKVDLVVTELGIIDFRK